MRANKNEQEIRYRNRDGQKLAIKIVFIVSSADEVGSRSVH